MNLELLKALETIRDKAAHACADITTTTAPADLSSWRNNKGAWATKFSAPFDIHTIAHAACESAYADMDAEAEDRQRADGCRHDWVGGPFGASRRCDRCGRYEHFPDLGGMFESQGGEGIPV